MNSYLEKVQERIDILEEAAKLSHHNTNRLLREKHALCEENEMLRETVGNRDQKFNDLCQKVATLEAKANLVSRMADYNMCFDDAGDFFDEARELMRPNEDEEEWYCPECDMPGHHEHVKLGEEDEFCGSDPASFDCEDCKDTGWVMHQHPNQCHCKQPEQTWTTTVGHTDLPDDEDGIHVDQKDLVDDETPLTCWECNGSGEMFGSFMCERCDGTGVYTDPYQEGVIHGLEMMQQHIHNTANSDTALWLRIRDFIDLHKEQR